MLMLKYLKFLLILSAGLLVTACETSGIAAGDPASAPSEVQTVTEYRLGVGDQLRVIVFGEDNLSGEFVVDSGGAVSLPLIGEVQASNRTIREFQRAVEAKLLDGYLKNPKVSAEVLNFRPFYILGEVGQSGEYPYSNGLTVLNAVATAGGFTYRANKKVVFIKHAGEQNELRYSLTASTPVQPGDTIRIGERLF